MSETESIIAEALKKMGVRFVTPLELQPKPPAFRDRIMDIVHRIFPRQKPEILVFSELEEDTISAILCRAGTRAKVCLMTRERLNRLQMAGPPDFVVTCPDGNRVWLYYQESNKAGGQSDPR